MTFQETIGLHASQPSYPIGNFGMGKVQFHGHPQCPAILLYAPQAKDAADTDETIVFHFPAIEIAAAFLVGLQAVCNDTYGKTAFDATVEQKRANLKENVEGLRE